MVFLRGANNRVPLPMFLTRPFKRRNTVSSRVIRVIAVGGLLLLSAVTYAEVPLEEFTKLPLYNDLKISPTGEFMAATVREDDGQMNLMIMRTDGSEITAVVRGFRNYFINNFFWANDERIVASLARQFGSLDAPSGTHEIVAVNWDGKRREWLFGRGSKPNVAFDRTYKVASLLNPLDDDNKHILVGVNNYAQANSSFTEVFKLNIYSGRMSRVTRAPARGAQVVTDTDGVVRLAVSIDPDNKNATVVHEHDGKRWNLLGTYHGKEGTITPVAFAPDNEVLYILDNRETDTNSLYSFNTRSEATELLYSHEVVDVSRVEFTPDGHLPGIHNDQPGS
jgi:acylaminoacyl-peptidase